MQFKRSFKMAISSLLSSKVRALLTMLGIIIGISSVIVIVSLVNGFKTSMTSTFEEMGTNIITSNITHPMYAEKINPEEIFEFQSENSEYISYVSPQISMNDSIKFGDTSIRSSGIGVSEQYSFIKNMAIESGENINYINTTNYDKVVVIGSYVAKELFGGTDPVGEYIKIGSDKFKVIGVLEEKAGSTETSADNTFLIPYTTASRIAYFPSPLIYLFSGATPEDSIYAQKLVDDYFIENLGGDTFYNSISLEDMLKDVNSLTSMLTLLLVGIAGISLFVGGIGIMNIMLVSVSERTREIGIRKSLGGKRKDILSQFIIESGVTSSIGGIIGVFLGIICSFIVGNLLNLDVQISIVSIIVSFSISVMIGVFFGYFPALKASKLNPIDALRFD